MRYPCLAVLACLVNGCGCEPADADLPVDMIYRVSIETLETDGGDEEPPDGTTAYLDVLLRTNGNYNISHTSIWIPGLWEYEDVIRKDGRVDHLVEVTAKDDGETYEQRLEGVVTVNEVDLTVTSNDRRVRDGKRVRCLNKARLEGRPRPLLDPAAYDGRYSVAYTPFGEACPGGPPRQPGDTLNLVIDIGQPVPETLEFALGPSFHFSLPTPGEDGAVDWSGPMQLDFFGFFSFPFRGSVKGALKPDNVDFSLEYSPDGATDGCTVLEVYKGRKRLPSLTAVDNAYRLKFEGRNGCRDNDLDFEGAVELTSQPDGSILLDEYGTLVLLKNENGRLSATLGSEADGEVASYAGTVAPPLLEYSVEHKVQLSADQWCAVTYTATGRVCHLFE